jgi:lipopolysaccharide export LptBFGC system permease protein LptF
MLQNKIYQNFLKEILTTFLTIVVSLALIALTVRAVNFLDLIVDSGYPILVYFKYSFLNLFGLAPKFIPLAFIVSLIIFILKHIQDREFIILWVSGVKKIKIVNLFLFTSTIIMFLYLLFSIYLTPLALNKSRQILSNDSFNSFLPTVRSDKFGDSFKGFTYIVERKVNNELENIFLHDTGNNLKNLSSSNSDSSDISIFAKKGFVKDRDIFLINGQIISSKKDRKENELIEFQKLKINLGNFTTTTIKQPKLQEISTIKLISCFLNLNMNLKICTNDSKKEILPILIRRVILPFYIPVITLICSFLLLRTPRILSNKVTIFIYSFAVLILTELVIRYTGLNPFLRITYIIAPIIMMLLLYLLLIYKFNMETKIK